MINTTADQSCKQASSDLHSNKSRYCIFVLKDDKDLLVEKVGKRDEKWEDFVASFPEKDCRWGLCDFEYATNEVPPRQVSKIIFV